MVKLVVIIPAYNEEDNIGKVIQSIPRKVFGVNNVEVLVIDDGSTDRTVEMAMNAGADKVITHKTNLGVGAAFMTGIRNAISMNADMVVTLDADSQFDSKQISELIIPILENQFDVVIGSRFLNSSPKGIPKIKLIGNKIFSRMISYILGQKFSDTQTGFRAYSRDAILNISIVNEFTYTQEVLIDLKFKRFKILEIPVRVYYDSKRESRVVKNVFDYSFKASSIIFRTMIYHRPLLAFGLFGLFLCSIGIISKIFTITGVINISAGLSTGFIILGVVSNMMGLFASVMFRRQAFIEKNMRHHISNSNRTED